MKFESPRRIVPLTPDRAREYVNTALAQQQEEYDIGSRSITREKLEEIRALIQSTGFRTLTSNQIALIEALSQSFDRKDRRE
jgi:hypothetical protein